MERPEHTRAVAKLLSSRPVVAVLGARQVGKTTLARRLAASTTRPVTFFDLEDPRDAPKITPSMRAALEDLKLSRLYVVHAGRTSFDLDKRVRCVAASELLTEL